MATIKDDPKAANLLDFVSVKESDGNYNAVIGNAKSTRDLSALTLNEVFRLQKELVAQGRPSGAVGRYQFINKTLTGLVQQAGIDPATTKFTPELQDRLAIMLLNSRGLSRWKAGSLSDEDFASNLSKEWASLPDPNNDGRSHYDGDRAGNHAGRTLQQVYAMLQGARSAPAVAKAAPTAPAPQAPQQEAGNPFRTAFNRFSDFFNGRG